MVRQDNGGTIYVEQKRDTPALTIMYVDASRPALETRFSTTDILNKYGLLDANVIRELSVLGTRNRASLEQYGTFLRNARQSRDALDQIGNDLAALLPDNANYADLKTLLITPVSTTEQANAKSLVINRMKSILALDARSTDKNQLQ
jgi:hypothetical protein